jgi:hypothetical protein
MSVWRGRGRRYGFFSAEAEDGYGAREQPQIRYPQKEIKDYYQYLYDEVVPLAIQYGMPLDEFWHGDLRLLEAYQKAYVRNVSYVAWRQAEYNRFAMEIGAKNAMATKDSQRIKDWMEWKDPVQTKSKTIITQENLESEFRKSQFDQNAWLHNMMNK